MQVVSNHCLIQRAWGQLTDRKPIWIMRQAGRYLPEFRELRQKHSFFEICETPELACEATLMPIQRYDLDAAIIFSDILVIPKALGMTVEMHPGQGPVLPQPLTEPDQISILNRTNVIERLQHVGNAIKLTHNKLNGSIPLFGFAGAPWTLMAYMIEGGGTKTCSKAKRWLYQYQNESHRLLNILSEVIIDYLIMQVHCGADILQIFDSTAEYLNADLYQAFALPYVKKISESVQRKLGEMKVPMVIFAKGAHHSLKALGQAGYQVIGLDWTIPSDLFKRELHGSNVTLQGNLDPCALYAPKEKLEELVRKMLEDFKGTNHIINLGHGIYPDTDPEAVRTVINVIREK